MEKELQVKSNLTDVELAKQIIDVLPTHVSYASEVVSVASDLGVALTRQSVYAFIHSGVTKHAQIILECLAVILEREIEKKKALENRITKLIKEAA